MENKLIHLQITKAAHNSSIGTGDCYPLVPPVPQGVDEWQRIGDKIKPKYLKVTGMISLAFDPSVPTPALGGGSAIGAPGKYESPLVCRMIAFTQNDIKFATTGSAVDVGSLLRGDNGASIAFTGLTGDLLRPVNTDKFKVLKDKRYELVPISGNTVDGVYKTNYRFSFKVKCPSTFKYDVNSANLPNNFAPFISIGYAYPNGSVPDVTQTPVIFEVHSTLVYEDA